MFDLAKFGLMLFLAAGGLTAVGIKWRNYITGVENKGFDRCESKYKTQNQAITEEKTKEITTAFNQANRNVIKNSTATDKAKDIATQIAQIKDNAIKQKAFENMYNNTINSANCLTAAVDDENQDISLCLEQS